MISVIMAVRSGTRESDGVGLVQEVVRDQVFQGFATGPALGYDRVGEGRVGESVDRA